MDKEKLNKQKQYWDTIFSNKPGMFGSKPSIAALKAAKIFKEKKISNILELGAGQGRDTLFFAKEGFQVQALDYSQVALNSIIEKANTLGLSKLITTKCYDIRESLPFDNETFNGCFSHMLYCMAFTNKELKSLTNEINRVLKFNALNIYTVRHTKDGDYKAGIHRGENLYESGGFIVHFFSEEKITQLSNGFEIMNIESFEEGDFPRKLFRVTLKKIKM